MDKARGAAADPVRVLFCETFDTRNDETTLGGVVGHVGRHETSAASHRFGLLEGEPVSAHEHLKASVIAQAHDHANAR